MMHRSSSGSEPAAGSSLTEDRLSNPRSFRAAAPQGIDQKLGIRVNERAASKVDRAKQAGVLEERSQAGWSEPAKFPGLMKLLLGRIPACQNDQNPPGAEKPVEFLKQRNRIELSLQNLVDQQEIELPIGKFQSREVLD